MCKKSNNEVCAHIECAAPKNEANGNKSASVTGSKACIRPAKDYGDKELIDLALEIHARACVYQTPALHDRAIEARTELLRRLREKP